MSFTIVIPTYNMSEYLPELWQSLSESGVAALAERVLFVDDGSSDNTQSSIEQLKSQAGDKIDYLRLARNQGRFLARLNGARAVKTPQILFLDSRLVLQPGFSAALAHAAQTYPQAIGIVDIDVRRSVFALYWDRSHRRIFWRHFRDTQKPLTLTPENYDRYLKGTTVFLCDRDVFIRACEKFESSPLLNDDTFLMKEMVKEKPIVIAPDLRILWTPRETSREFLARLWERGPSFVEYHVFERKSGPFFWVVALGIAALCAWLVMLFVQPIFALALALSAIVAAAGSTALFARSPLEWMRLMPLHVAVITVFGAGILRGLWVNSKKAVRA